MSYEAKSRQRRGCKGVHVPDPIPSTPAKKADEGTRRREQAKLLVLALASPVPLALQTVSLLIVVIIWYVAV